MNLYTIGFTKKTAEYFFEAIRKAGIKRILDVRLNNVSQLAGFAKKNDLKFFAKELCEADYVHLPELAPTKDILDAYKKNKGSWQDYENEFLELMKRRRIEETLSKELFDDGCLLCSEDKPHHCHRRLVADYLNQHWGNIQVTHLT